MNTVVVKSIDEPEVRRQMHRHAARLFASHPEIEEIVVFGSFESGTYAPGSDLDVFLVLTSSPKVIRERIPDYLPQTFPVAIDLFPYTRDEIAALAPSPVLEAVRRSRWRYSNRVALDSDVLDFLVQASDPEFAPDRVGHADQAIAVLRIWFYGRLTFDLLPTVAAQKRRIPDASWRAIHERFGDILMDEPVSIDRSLVKSRVRDLGAHHGDPEDVQILAEAEAAGMDTLLTNDKTFARKLAARTPLWLTSPSEFWAAMEIPRGSAPKTVAHPRNPLSQEVWWRW